MNQWDNEIADDLANAAEIFEPTDPTATYTPQQQPVPRNSRKGRTPCQQSRHRIIWPGTVLSRSQTRRTMIMTMLTMMMTLLRMITTTAVAATTTTTTTTMATKTKMI